MNRARSPLAPMKALASARLARFLPTDSGYAPFGWRWLRGLNVLPIALLGFEDLRPLVEDAFAREFIGSWMMTLVDFEEDLHAAQAAEDRIAFLAERRIAPLEDAITRLSGWHGFSEAYREEERLREERERARLAMRTRSIWGGVMIHIGVALTMDMLALRGLPPHG